MAQQVNDNSSLAELLLDEFTHRINNELAALTAIVLREQAMNRDEATGRALKRVHARLLNVGRVQLALQGPRGLAELDAADYLRRLCEGRRAVLEGIELCFEGCPVRLDAERCRRLGMIVSELVENARKHAFTGIARGSISVELQALDGQLQCRVCDNGCGYFGGTPGQGLTIVHALAGSLNGSLSHETADEGTVWMLTIPRDAPSAISSRESRCDGRPYAGPRCPADRGTRPPRHREPI
jgi:two-component sensor histidine kinase